jgi:hypothetical protein
LLEDAVGVGDGPVIGSDAAQPARRAVSPSAGQSTALDILLIVILVLSSWGR